MGRMTRETNKKRAQETLTRQRLLGPFFVGFPRHSSHFEPGSIVCSEFGLPKRSLDKNISIVHIKKKIKTYQGLETVASRALASVIASVIASPCPHRSSRVRVDVSVVAGYKKGCN